MVHLAQGPQKRCLSVRCAAAAAGGHAGAQVAIAREAAVGARVSVFWRDDDDWYTGTVTEFDRHKWQHTVHYDDGDVEIFQMWHPKEQVGVFA
jgi:hypothetical protein